VVLAAALVVAGASASVLASVDDPYALLAAYERERVSAFRRPGDAEDFLAAHVLVRQVAARWLGTSAPLTLRQSCPRCDRPHGQPSIVEDPGVAVSLSHTRGYVAAAAGAGPLGVDVEHPRSASEDLVESVLTPAEVRLVRGSAEPPAAFLDLWVRKEALIKAGRATLDKLASVDLAADRDGWDGLTLTGWRGAGGQLGACAALGPATVDLLD
jgi:4'-phosphopantetheinyl transferase